MSLQRRPLLLAALAALAAAGTGCAQSPPASGPRFVDSADGVRIAYRVQGRGDTLLVLVHGWSCNSSFWEAQVSALAARYAVATLDLAGHGASGRDRRDWTMGRFGDDVVAVVRALPQQRVVLVGHSMGGPVVLEAARRLPQRVIAVVGVDSMKSVGLPARPAQAEALLQAMARDFAGTTRAMVERLFTADGDVMLKQRIADQMSAAPPELAMAAVRALNAMDYPAALAGSDVPIVLINSDLGGATDAARLQRVSPRFRVLTMTGRGHFLMMEDPLTFNALLQAEIEARLDSLPH